MLKISNLALNFLKMRFSVRNSGFLMKIFWQGEDFPAIFWQPKFRWGATAPAAFLTPDPLPSTSVATPLINSIIQQEILLDCDQSNVLLARIIFFWILLRAFSFLSACIKDLASNWDPFYIILIVTGVEVVIGNCLPEVHIILPDFNNWEENIFNRPNGRWR